MLSCLLPHLVLDLDILALGTMPNNPHALASQPVENSSRSVESSAPGSPGPPLPFTQPSAPTEVCHHTTAQFSGPVQWILGVTELPQDLYNRQQSGQSNNPLPSISFWPYSYPISSVLEAKNRRRDLKELVNYNQIAFKDHKFGQKLSWRFLFKDFPKFEKQFNVLDAVGTQPTVQRIVIETAKALDSFKAKQPRFPYNLHRLVILEVMLVSHVSVQAKIGLVDFATVNQVVDFDMPN